MGTTAMALGLIVLTLAAGCLLWTLLLHFEEIYPAARKARVLFLALTGVTTVGIFAVLLLEVRQLVSS